MATQSNANANNGYCIACNITCFSCVANNPNNCTACYAGATYNSVQMSCTSCLFPCITCAAASNSSCTSCPSGYILQNFACTLISSSNNTCSQNCATCQITNNVQTCLICLPGYILSNANQCIPCMQNCSVCTLNKNVTINNQPVCVSCSIGYYLNALSDLCTPCALNCAGCLNSTVCFSCLQGYTLTSTYQCFPRCNYPCTSCSQTNPSFCTSCQAGFTFNSNNNTCTAQCTSSSNNCTICPLGYSINIGNNTQTCVQCTPASNCSRCDSTNPSNCLSCAFGLYLNSNLSCVPCPTGCSNCLGGSVCFRCQVGYVALLQASLLTGAYINRLLANSVSTSNAVYQPVNCVACASPCNTCLNNPNICTSCVSGYSLRGTTCISSFYFAVSVQFSVTPSVFLNNYYNFLLQLSASINQNIGTVLVNSIVYGSATASLSVTTTATQGSSTAATQQQNLTTFTTQGTTIANMAILTSSVASTTTSGGSS